MALNGVYDIFNERWGGQTTYIFSDPHFDDKELEMGTPGRPSAEEIVKRINSKVGRKDTFICLGDIHNVDYVRQIRGYKVLICGNHDLGASNYKRQIIKYQYDADEYLKAEVEEEMRTKHPGWKINIDFDHSFTFPFVRWVVTADNQLFDEVYTGPLIIGEKLILSHEPIPNITWAMNVHGHVHNKNAKNDKYHFNCCADVIDYSPINLNQWLKESHLSKIETTHRTTINKATQRAKKRGKKK